MGQTEWITGKAAPSISTQSIALFFLILYYKSWRTARLHIRFRRNADIRSPAGTRLPIPLDKVGSFIVGDKSKKNSIFAAIYAVTLVQPRHCVSILDVLHRKYTRDQGVRRASGNIADLVVSVQNVQHWHSFSSTLRQWGSLMFILIFVWCRRFHFPQFTSRRKFHQIIALITTESRDRHSSGFFVFFACIRSCVPICSVSWSPVELRLEWGCVYFIIRRISMYWQVFRNSCYSKYKRVIWIISSIVQNWNQAKQNNIVKQKFEGGSYCNCMMKIFTNSIYLFLWQIKFLNSLIAHYAIYTWYSC